MTALFANTFENVGRTLLNFLAIGGGFLLGSVLMWFVVRMVAKFTFQQKPNKAVDMVARGIGGIAGALLIALLVFGDGGWGFGGSGGGRPGGPGGKDLQQPNTPATNKETDKAKPEIPPIKVTPEDLSDRVKIVILGGSVKDDKFYLLEQPMSLDELKKALETRNQQKKLNGLTVFVYKNSAALDSAVVSDLKDLARKLQLSIDFPPVQRELRPER